MARGPAPAGGRGFRALPFLLALALGTLGGWIFARLHLPLPWMLGAMTAVTIAAIAGIDVAMPRWLRTACITVLGVMLGASFTPAVVARRGEWIATLLALVVWAAVNGGAGWWYFRRWARFDRVTAYFAASPGGLNEMTLVGGQMGGDERTISLVHATRVFITVFTIPIWFQFHGGLASTTDGRAFVGLLAVDPIDYAVLGASAVIGALGAARLGLPAAAVLGPMILSAIVHLAGVTDSSPPTLIVSAAQVVVGATLGCRFVGFPLGLAGRTIGHGAVVGLVMIAITVAFGMLMARLTGLPLAAIILGYAPGGLAEMSLVAIALAVDAAFVATHHIVRIILIVTCAPLVFSRLGMRR